MKNKGSSTDVVNETGRDPKMELRDNMTVSVPVVADEAYETMLSRTIVEEANPPANTMSHTYSCCNIGKIGATGSRFDHVSICLLD